MVRKLLTEHRKHSGNDVKILYLILEKIPRSDMIGPKAKYI